MGFVSCAAQTAAGASFGQKFASRASEMISVESRKGMVPTSPSNFRPSNFRRERPTNFRLSIWCRGQHANRQTKVCRTV